MVLGTRVRLLAGKAPLNPGQTLVWEMSEEIEYIPATGINELARHPESGYCSKYGCHLDRQILGQHLTVKSGGRWPHLTIGQLISARPRGYIDELVPPANVKILK